MAKYRIDPDTPLREDAIRLGRGKDGNEPREIGRRQSWILKSPEFRSSEFVRIAVVINTLYESLGGGFYFNPRIVATMQRALEACNRWLVLPDLHGGEAMVPTTWPGALAEREEYLVIDSSMQIRGYLIMWAFCMGGGGRFYSDDQVMDFLFHADDISTIVGEIQRECNTSSIRTEDWGELNNA